MLDPSLCIRKSSEYHSHTPDGKAKSMGRTCSKIDWTRILFIVGFSFYPILIFSLFYPEKIRKMLLKYTEIQIFINVISCLLYYRSYYLTKLNSVIFMELFRSRRKLGSKVNRSFGHFRKVVKDETAHGF